LIQNIVNLNIKNFRHLVNHNNIEIGEKITVISGENGTGKSSFLGLIGHVFSYRKGENKKAQKGIDNKSLETLFSEVFKFSPEKEVREIYNYSIQLNNRLVKVAQSRYIETNKRFRIDVGDRSKGEGKISKPVIYLGLKRLIPLAQENESSINFEIEDKLTNDEKELFKNWHNKILVMEDIVIPKPTKSKNKMVYSVTTEEYDAYGNSAGQDNIAQIILAILSLKREYENNTTTYNGGLLLIDEIDATLYPAAQKNLIDLLLKVCSDYKIQVVFTTHSIEILNHIFHENRKKFQYYSKIVFLQRIGKKIKIVQEIDKIDGIIAELAHKVLKINNCSPKINTYFEDEEARIFFKNITNKKLLKLLKVQKNNLGSDFYLTLIKQKFPEFKQSILVLDGDCTSKIEQNKYPRILTLPGYERPENVLCSFLNKLVCDDVFWSTQPGGYNKSAFINSVPANISDRAVMKKWFNSEKQFWGRGCTKLFSRWKIEYKKDIQDFNVKLEKLIKNLTN
jgi:predicted ATPase